MKGKPAQSESGHEPQQDGDRLESALAGALAEYVDLHAEAEDIDIDSFCRKFPAIENELRAAVGTLASLDEAAPCAPPQDPDFPMPDRLSGHKLLHEIGAGGMARVFLALDERLGRKVAIKVLKKRYWDHGQVRTRFLREAQALARLRHPNIVQIYHLGDGGDFPHFVMEYVEGAPLTTAAAPLPLQLKVDLFRKICLGVHYLHQNQLVHRDLKPGNILVGPELEPKLLDFGLARQVEGTDRQLTMHGEILGTPQYFSPEQARGTLPLNPRSDVFTLGILLYELLTGSLPFRANDYAKQMESICESDPHLPRRLNPEIPGQLQNICLQALEKDPARRYSTAREMADDLARFLAGEPVLAAPPSYGRRMSGKIEQHLRELDGWRQDRIVSDLEFEAIRRSYGRLVEREDAWIMEVRRLSLPQVGLYLGAWITVVGAALMFLFQYPALPGWADVAVVAGAALPSFWIGIRSWAAGRLRIAVAYLLAFCLLLPISLVVIMQTAGLFSGLTRGREDLELIYQFRGFQPTTNAQIWWAIFLSLPAYLWLRRRTKSSVFSLVFSVMAALLWGVTLLRMGMIDWLEKDPGLVYLRLLPPACTFFLCALVLERRRFSWDARHFYPVAVLLTYVALSGIAAAHKPYAQWLGRVAPWTRGQVDYLFVLNAGIYFLLQFACDRIGWPLVRVAAKAFRFVLPGHILIPLLLLGMEATRRWNESPFNAGMRREAHIFEVLLPLAACLFVLLSIPKQMKNYLGTGMLFLAVGIVRLQQNWLKEVVAWPITLIIAGILAMLWASRYAAFRMAMKRFLRRR